MGNRAVISFQDSSENTLDTSQVGIYLHWNGGLESIEAFCEAASALGVDEPARFIQMIGNWFGGNSSLYVDVISRLDYDNGDNGTYVISKASGKWKVVQRFFAGQAGNYRVAGHDEHVRDMAEDVTRVNADFFVNEHR
tara:strand:- start:460 stop:873 length:414 start_codon:yes stop_codon:yes gene_type:complete